MIEIKILEVPGCACCGAVKKIIEKLKKEFSLNVEVIDVTKHPEILQKYTLLTSPGIVINGKLELVGEVSESELREKLKSIK